MTALEFRIPITANQSMYSNVRLAALSLARLGPPYSTARILVSIGGHVSYEQVLKDTPWAQEFPIEWRIVSYQAFEANPISASGNDRFSENPRADVVVLCDADLCVISRFDELLADLAKDRPLVAGLQAHYCPFIKNNPETNDATWAKLLEAVGASDRSLDHGYSMVADYNHGRCPPYFNYGFVAFNRAAFHRVAPITTKYTEVARRLLMEGNHNPGFQAQVGLALALAVAEVNALLLSHAYNCANDDDVFIYGLSDVGDVKALHYLRNDEFDRGKFLVDPAAYRSFISSPLRNRISERLRQHILSLPL